MLKGKKKMLGVCLLLILAGCLVFFFGNRTPAETSWNGTTYEHIAYSDVSDSDYLNLYIPKSDEKLPLLILVHGGGFFENDCTSTEAAYMYEYFRSQGYACASVNYRLSGEAAFPAAVNDVKAAVRFLHANADQYGLDEEKFIIWGESAGGYLATMAAVTSDEQFADVKFIGEDEGTATAKVCALVDFYGVLEFYEMDSDFKTEHVPNIIRKIVGISSDGMTDSADSPESMFVGKAVGDLTEEEKEVLSPYTYLEENLEENADLMVYIRHSKVDITVPYLQSVRIADKYEELLGEDHVNCKIFKTYNHASGRYYSNKNLSELNDFLNQIVNN
jgi:acetyl esterase/lipase